MEKSCLVIFILVIICATGDTKAEELSKKETSSKSVTPRERFLIAVLKFSHGECYSSSNTANGRPDGVCIHKKECQLKGGQTSGTCNVFGSCCKIERTCYNTTSWKISYFVNPNPLQPTCPLTVDFANRDVCQIRLDFETFTIAQPTGPINGSDQTNGYTCVSDSFTVTDNNGNLGFTSLCGENGGQHIYIPVNATQGQKSITLTFNLADRNNNNLINTNLPDPRWRIRITQLECPAPPKDFSTVHSSLNSVHYNKYSTAASDFYWLAPRGCLQYYPDRTGTYMSFNYNSGNGPYLAMLNYAICFRRTPDVCGIQHTAQTFVLAANSYTNNFTAGMIGGTDRDCDTLPVTNLTATTYTSMDYLFIPDGRVSTTNSNTGFFYASKYCDNSIGPNLNSIPASTVTSYAPGPQFVFFHSDAFALQALPEIGFKIMYQQLTGSCRNLVNFNG